MKIKLIFLSIVLLCLSCGQSQTEIKGEIFIATKSGQSYKLGAIPVKIIKKGKVENLNDFEANFSVADYTATSDADGKFSAKIPYGDYVAIADAKRDVFGDTENYFWRVNFTADGQETSVVLNNLNLKRE